MQHADFLAAICANPDADAPRLIYADWLEEQGDWRAEALRWLVRDVKTELSWCVDGTVNHLKRWWMFAGHHTFAYRHMARKPSISVAPRPTLVTFASRSFLAFCEAWQLLTIYEPVVSPGEVVRWRHDDFIFDFITCQPTASSLA